MKTLLIGLCASALLIIPVSGSAAWTPEDERMSAVSPAVVREGELALRMTEVLGLGRAWGEAGAESALAAAGIAPRNGWIADYPVTPDVLGELLESVALAAKAGSIPLLPDDAVTAFIGLALELGLPLPGDSAYAYGYDGYYPANGAACDAAIVERYYERYYAIGPPVISYCHPPARWAGLYYRVPFRFWLLGIRWSHYYILRDFHIVVHTGHRYYRQPVLVGYAAVRTAVAGPKVISNHVRDNVSGEVRRIAPLTRRTATAVREHRARDRKDERVAVLHERRARPSAPRVESRARTDSRVQPALRQPNPGRRLTDVGRVPDADRAAVPRTLLRENARSGAEPGRTAVRRAPTRQVEAPTGRHRSQTAAAHAAAPRAVRQPQRVERPAAAPTPRRAAAAQTSTAQARRAASVEARSKARAKAEEKKAANSSSSRGSSWRDRRER
jgi:hypothetical protein